MRTPLSAASVLTALAIAFAVRSTRAENWPHWRGPQFDGSSPERDLPSSFSKTEHVRWIAPMPGPAAATPIVWENQIFISSIDRQAGTLVAFALDRQEGKVLWTHEIAAGISKDDRSNFASGSPTTDGRLVFFYYGNGDLVAFDRKGTQVWARNIQKEYGPYAFQWTFSSSPTLYKGKLYLQVLQRNVPVNGHGRTDGPNESYLLALDPNTGRQVWKQNRPSEARQESLEAYSTPIPYSYQGGDEILILGGDCISGAEAATGAELWRWGTWNPGRITHWRMVVSPVAGDGIVLACAPKGSPVYAVKLGGKGTLDNSALAWVSKDRQVSSDVSTPLFYKNRFYVMNSDRKVLSAIEPATGRVIWTGALPSQAKIESSPTAGDDKLYMINHRGEVYVVAAGGEFKLLHTAALGEEADNNVRSSIAISDGQLFVRTNDKLYCIGN